MEWIKVKASHALYEYPELSGNEYRAWIKAMCLTAVMEKLPTSEVLSDFIHKSTLSSLDLKFKSHSTSLQIILKKVLEDVEYTKHIRAKNKSKIAEWRTKQANVTQLHEPVTLPVTLPDKIREDKIREDKIDTTLSQVADLLASFPVNIQKLITVYIDRIRLKNKSQVITEGRKNTLITELWNTRERIKNDGVFIYGMEQAIGRDACCIGYVNAVVKNKLTKRPV